MVLFFQLNGLEHIHKLSAINEIKEKVIEYVLALQLHNSSFTCSVLYAGFGRKSRHDEGHIVFTFSALNCLAILSALDKVDR
jgi:prenyltransferase beta subunit